MDKMVIYTDGSTIGNGRPDATCGWAFKQIYRGKTLLKSGIDEGRSNNQMEMIAALQAMRSVTDKRIPTEIRSDSRYVVETMNGAYQARTNLSLWQLLFVERKKFAEITFTWVHGHDKDRHNREVDKEARRRADRREKE